MIRFLTDENFNGRIVRSVRRERPDADFMRVQDTAMYTAADPQVLEWAARQGRILLTHDVETMVGYAYARIVAGQPMPGVIVVRSTLPVGQAVADLLAVLGASEMKDWDNRVVFLPL